MNVFISDSHLGSGSDSLQREMELCRLLDSIKQDCDRLFLLGDIFDFWFTYRRLVPRGNVRLLGKLAELADNGVEIRYGKNLVALDYVLNGADVFNAVAPFWTNDAMTVYLDHLVVKSGETAQNAIPLDLSSEFETEPTSAQLEAAAQAYIDASGNYSLKENITVDFYPIWQTSEYNVDERVKLCDTVTVIFGGYNIKAKAKVVKVIYDTLRDRYKSIELGSTKTTFAQEITQIVSDNIMGDVGSLVKRTAADAIPDASTTERGLVQFPITLAQGGTGQTGQTAQQSYTPTVKIGTTAQTVASLSAYYKSWGLMKLIGGRFNLTTTGTGQLIISLPTGFTVPTSSAQPMGILIAPDQKAYHIRVTSNGLAALSNGGSNVAWATGYYCFWVVVMGN